MPAITDHTLNIAVLPISTHVGWTGDRLRFHAGSIQAALVLDFGQSADYNYLGALLGTFYTSHSIYLTLPPAIEGTDGQMPNLDLLNVIVEIARYEGVPVQLHSTYFNSKPIQQNNQPYLLEWMNAMRNVLTMMLNQASGVPSGLHGLFLRYRIDALTLCGVQGPLSVRLGVWQTAMVVESTFRSLNNLLERFHQSFFYYLLAQPYRYISIAMYYPPLGLIVAGMLLVVRMILMVSHCINTLRFVNNRRLVFGLKPVNISTRLHWNHRPRHRRIKVFAGPCQPTILVHVICFHRYWCFSRAFPCPSSFMRVRLF